MTNPKPSRSPFASLNKPKRRPSKGNTDAWPMRSRHYGWEHARRAAARSDERNA